MAKKPTKAQAKIGKVMHEWKAGKLHAGKDPDGKGPKKAPVVKSQKQAIAVALRQAGVAKKKPVKMATGGIVPQQATATNQYGGLAAGDASRIANAQQIASQGKTQQPLQQATPMEQAKGKKRRAARATVGRSPMPAMAKGGVTMKKGKC